MSPNSSAKSFHFHSQKLLSWSITVAMTLGLLVSIPKQVTAQAQTTQSAQQSAELQEAEKLNQQVVQLYRQGKYSEAIPLAEKALAIREKVLGKEHPDVATSLNNLALLYRVQGNYSKAEPFYLHSLAIREKVLGKEHPYVATILNNLGALYRVQGNYAEAEPLYTRALAIREKVLSKEHPSVANSLNNLAGTELVVLSACETGIGDVKTGDGVYGLRRALVIAGSQSQLLSLWKVADNGTKDLMVEYYQKIKAGKGRHEALREVQLEFLNSNTKYQHPYFWASFIPSGNWKKMR